MVLVLTARHWDFEIDRGPAWLFVRPRQAGLEVGGAGALAEQVWALLEQNFTNRLVLELDELPQLDAQLVDELLALEARIAAGDGLLRLCALSSGNRQALARHDVHRRLHAFADRHEAVLGRAAALGRASAGIATTCYYDQWTSS